MRDVSAGFVGIQQPRGDDFRAGFSLVVGWVRRKWVFFRGARPFYPGEAPSSIAMCRKVARNGNDRGRCTTIRRTETTTRVPSFKKRSHHPHAVHWTTLGLVAMLSLLVILRERFFLPFCALYLGVTLAMNIAWKLGWRGIEPPLRQPRKTEPAGAGPVES